VGGRHRREKGSRKGAGRAERLLCGASQCGGQLTVIRQYILEWQVPDTLHARKEIWTRKKALPCDVEWGWAAGGGDTWKGSRSGQAEDRTVFSKEEWA
jgi:hypothetical protein